MSEHSEGVLKRDAETGRFVVDMGPNMLVELSCGRTLDVWHLGSWWRARVEFNDRHGGYYLVVNERGISPTYLGVGCTVRLL